MIFPVPGFSLDGTFSIFMVRRALSASTAISWVLRSSAGSAQISSLVRSGPTAGEAERGGDVDVGREAGRTLARGSLEHPERRVEAFDGDAVLLQIGRAGERARRLAGDHPHFGDLALGRRPDRVEPEQRAGGEHDAGAGLACAADQVVMYQERGAAHRDQGPAGLDRAGGDFGEGGLGHALDDDVRELRQGRRVHHGDAGRDPFAMRVRALARSRLDTAARSSPSMPAASARTTGNPTAPSPATPTRFAGPLIGRRTRSGRSRSPP